MAQHAPPPHTPWATHLREHIHPALPQGLLVLEQPGQRRRRLCPLALGGQVAQVGLHAGGVRWRSDSPGGPARRGAVRGCREGPAVGAAHGEWPDTMWPQACMPICPPPVFRTQAWQGPPPPCFHPWCVRMQLLRAPPPLLPRAPPPPARLHRTAPPAATGPTLPPAPPPQSACAPGTRPPGPVGPGTGRSPRPVGGGHTAGRPLLGACHVVAAIMQRWRGGQHPPWLTSSRALLFFGTPSSPLRAMTNSL